MPNTLPVSDAGPDQLITVSPYEGTLAGEISDLDIADTVTGLWTKSSGPGAVTFDDDTDPHSDFSVNTRGVYVLNLAANDGTATVNDTVTITANVPPVAAAGDDQIVLLGNDIVLDATDTTGDVGATLDYEWTQLTGPETLVFDDDTDPGATITGPLLPGHYNIRLTVTDDLGAVSTDDMILYVSQTTVLPKFWMVQVADNVTNLPQGANAMVVYAESAQMALDAACAKFTGDSDDAWQNATLTMLEDTGDLEDLTAVVQIQKVDGVSTEFRFTAGSGDTWDDMVTALVGLMAADADLGDTTNEGSGVLRVAAADDMGDKVITAWVESNGFAIADMTPTITAVGASGIDRDIVFDDSLTQPLAIAAFKNQ